MATEKAAGICASFDHSFFSANSSGACAFVQARHHLAVASEIHDRILGASNNNSYCIMVTSASRIRSKTFCATLGL